MTAIIKAGEADGRVIVRDFGAKRPGPAYPRAVAEESAAAALSAEIARLKAALGAAEARHAEELKKAAADSFADGERAGRADAARNEAASLEALRAGIAAGVAGIGRRFDQLESLAGALCRVALEDVFSPSHDYREQCARMLRRQIETLKPDTVLGVAVSAADFQEDGALTDLAREFGLEPANFRIDPALEAGACRLQLRLGQLDLSLSDHWDGLCAAFRAMADR